MASYSEIKKRREIISVYLTKGILSPGNLAKVTGYDVNLIKNDLAYFKRNSNKWLTELAKDGYIFQSQNINDQLQNMIEELQQKRTEKKVTDDVDLLIKVVLTITQLLSLKWQLISNGPMLTTMKKMMERVKGDVL